MVRGILLQVIGSYLLNFTTEMLMVQNTADIIVGQDMLLKHQEKCV